MNRGHLRHPPRSLIDRRLSAAAPAEQPPSDCRRPADRPTVRLLRTTRRSSRTGSPRAAGVAVGREGDPVGAGSIDSLAPTCRQSTGALLCVAFSWSILDAFPVCLLADGLADVGLHQTALRPTRPARRGRAPAPGGRWPASRPGDQAIHPRPRRTTPAGFLLHSPATRGRPNRVQSSRLRQSHPEPERVGRLQPDQPIH